MRVHLLAVGQKMPRWVRDGYLEYADRLRGELRLELKEIPPGKRGRNTDVSRAIELEGARLISAIPRRARVIALDVGGGFRSTEQLSREVENWLAGGSDVALLVGLILQKTRL